MAEAFFGLFIFRAGFLGRDFEAELAGFVQSATTEMVWQFLAGAAVFVVAFQITWSNLGDTATPPQLRRINRFRVGAIALGAVSINAWALFVTVYRGNGPGQLLVSILIAGVLFFAIDAATVVTRVDVRDYLKAAQRTAIRTYGTDFRSVERSIVRRSGQEFTSPTLMLTAAITALLSWWVLLTLIGIASVSFSVNGPSLLSIISYWAESTLEVLALSLLLSFFCFYSIELFRIAQRSRPSKRRYVLGGFGLLAPFVGIVSSMMVSFVNAGTSAGVEILTIATIAVPAALPLTAAILPTIGSKHWWTPRGSVRIGRTALARLGLEYRQRRLTGLGELFGETGPVPLPTEPDAHDDKMEITLKIRLPLWHHGRRDHH